MCSDKTGSVAWLFHEILHDILFGFFFGVLFNILFGFLFDILFRFLFDTLFTIGWLGITWLYPVHVTSVRMRAEANSLSTSANRMFEYAVVELSPIMINTVAWRLVWSLRTTTLH